MAGVSAGRLSIEIVAEIARLQADLDKAKNLVKQASGDIAKSAKAANDNLAGLGSGLTKTGNTGRLAGHHMQNLAFQFQDLGIQMSMAAQSSEPLKMALMALMQQGSQISGIMSQAGVGVGGLVKQLVVAHPILAAIAVAAGVASAAIGFMTSEINKNSSVHVTWMDTLLGTYDAIKAYLTNQLTAAFDYFGVKSQDVWADVVNATKWAVNWMIGAISLVPRALVTAWNVLPAAAGDIMFMAANSVIRGINAMIHGAVEILNGFITTSNKVLDRVGLGVPTLSAPQISEVANSYAGAAAKAGSAFAKVLTDTISRDFIGEGAGYVRPFAEARARKRLAEDAKKAGKEAGKSAGKAAADAFAEEFARSMNELTKVALQPIANRAEELVKFIKAAQKAGWDEFKAGTGSATDDRVKPFRDAAQATADWNAELDKTVGLLRQIGGFGNVLADIAGVFQGLSSGDFSKIGGPVGGLMQILGGTQWSTIDPATGDRTIHVLSDEIAQIFTKEGTFGKTMGDLLKGAGTGVAIGATLFGQNNQGAQVGGAIGGAIGQVAGEALGKAVGGTIGKLAGPLGAIAGSLLGSVVGALFTTKPHGSGTISNSGVTSQASNDQIKAGIDSFGLGTQNAISAIADQLGGKVGKYSIGVGRYKDYYQVSSQANDPLLGKAHYARDSANDLYDGLDPQAALRAAIAAAIKQGAIQGVRAGTQTLLNAGTDIEAQLKKALQFEGVFKDLKQATDPMGYALEELTRQFDNLKDIFKEAGATATEYADLEKLLALKRAEAVDDARQEIVSKVSDPFNMQIRLLELMGESEKSLAAQRLLELAGLKDSLQPMQAMIYTLEDARTVIDKFTPLRDDLIKLREELLGGTAAGSSFASVSGTFRSTAASAAMGDATALGNLRNATTDFLNAAKDNASSALEYRRYEAEALRAVDKGIFAADAQVDYQQAIIDATKANGTLLADMKANVAILATQMLTTQNDVAKIIKRWDAGENAVPLQVEIVA